MKFFIVLLFCVFGLHGKIFSQWELCNGKPLEGFVNGVTFVDTSIYVCTDKGIYLSTDEGESWDLKNSGLDFLNVYCLTIFENSMYAGTWGGGIYYSVADNVNWKSCNIGINDKYIYTIHSSDNKTYACTRNGIFTMSENSCSWTLSGFKNNAVYSIIEFEDLIIAGTDGNGVFISSDKGENWAEKNTGLDDLNINALCIMNDNIIAGTLTGIYISSDKGNTWIEKNVGITNNKIMSLEVFHNIIFAGTAGQGVFFSTDWCNTWYQKNNSITDLYIEKISSKDKYIMLVTKQGKIFYSKDSGETWSDEFNRVKKLDPVSSILSHNNILYAGSNSSKLYISTNHGKSWDVKIVDLLLSKSNISTLALKDSLIFAGSNSANKLYKSSDLGKNWISSNSNYSIYITAIHFFNDMVFVGTRNSGLFVSKNLGINWSLVSKFPIVHISSLSSVDDNLFCATYGWGIYHSSNEGVDWTKRNFGCSGDVHTIASNNDVMFAGTYSNGVYLSTDLGLSWGLSANGLANGKIRAVTIYNNDNIFVGNQVGIFISNNFGKSWTSINDGLTFQNYVEKIVFTDQYIFFLKSDGAVYRRKLSQLSLSVKNYENNNFYYIEMIPNPLSDFSTINIHIPEYDNYLNLSIKIFDIFGNKIKQFSDIDFSQKDINITWDGTDNYGNELPNGVYFIILHTGNSTITKNIVLSR